MSLKDLWLSSPEQIADKSISQIIAFVGDGKLRDGSVASEEFRSFLGHIPSDYLERYGVECLDKTFPESGLALQDIINEIGKRLGFKVEPGRYRGSAGTIGNDGIWRFPDGHAVVVEVKTTDAYRIPLDTIAQYRHALIGNQSILADKSSILIIVGRKDTGELEAQIRGSRHAWDMRLISIDALCHLMRLKEQLEDPATTRRIYEILIPREFTKLDAIIEIVFSATEDVQLQEEQESPDESEEAAESSSAPKFTPVAFNQQCITRIERCLKIKLVKRSKIKFATPDNKVAVVCAVSKVYERYSHPYFWYAFHPHQKDFLLEAETGYIALGCGSEENVLLVPITDFENWLSGMNVTHKDDNFYYHIQISNENGKYVLVRRKGEPRINLSKYLI